MSRDQVTCSPLIWEDFQFLLKHIDDKSKLASGTQKKTLLKYHAAIAIGGYTGPRPKELLDFRWMDFIDSKKKKIYQFKLGNNREVKYDEHLIGIVIRDMELVDPFNPHDFILQGSGAAPITTRAFNKMLRKLFEDAGIETDNPSAVTLRKTYALRVYRKYEELAKQDPGDGHLIDPLTMTSMHMGHKDTEHTRRYIFTPKFIERVSLNMH